MHRLAIYVVLGPYDPWDKKRRHDLATPIYLELPGCDEELYERLCAADDVYELPSHLYLAYYLLGFAKDGQFIDFIWRQNRNDRGPLRWTTADVFCSLELPLHEEGGPLAKAVYACLAALPPGTRIVLAPV